MSQSSDSNFKEGCSLEALFPRGLLVNCGDIINAPVTEEGLSPIRLCWQKDRISSIDPIKNPEKASLKVLLPRLLEPHTHIDKAFTWLEFPNLKGTYLGALSANLQEHKIRTDKDILYRAEKSLKLALANGLRAVRTHVDIFEKDLNRNWEIYLDLQNDWRDLIDLQLVALAPLSFWNSKKGEIFARKIATSRSLMGSVLAPPFDSRKLNNQLRQMILLANQFGCGVDLHIDESDLCPAGGIKQLIRVLETEQLSIPITCSHLSSMSLLPSNKLANLADRLANHGVNVVALPLTNAWLLGRKTHKKRTPIIRPIAPISQLQQAGVTVAIGGDNIQDAWYPGGGLDPLELISLSMPIAQMAPWNRLGLAPFTTAAASLMGIEWDGTLSVGCPADLMLLDANSWSEALSKPPSRDVLVKGQWIGKKGVFIQANEKIDL